ncbi:MerR family transcriptional regulator [Streptomyces sp. NPDC000594]|uniref:MerR family transcriptional regulator n=1 Tax=Streptomyces sp. NPDC000594 TaxID=3154261 RepID=UPI00332DBBD5
MRIGELSDRTGTPRRLLRYYEERGLIVADRSANGYREYDERYVDRVRQIRGLLEAGLPTRVIRRVLPCLDSPGTIHFPNPTPELLATLEQERDRMTERIAVLVRNRDAIAAYVDAVRREDRASAARSVPGPAGSAPGPAAGSVPGGRAAG